jgi:hypothetical protein
MKQILNSALASKTTRIMKWGMKGIPDDNYE